VAERPGSEIYAGRWDRGESTWLNQAPNQAYRRPLNATDDEPCKVTGPRDPGFSMAFDFRWGNMRKSWLVGCKLRLEAGVVRIELAASRCKEIVAILACA
jgi:hypothetical protein